MDSISRPEFAAIFDRVSTTVDLRGATSAARIGNYLKIVRQYSKDKAKESKWSWERKRHGYAAEEYDKLIEHDFAGRTIYEANRNPRGIIALTLKYGKREAEARMKAQARAKVRSGM